ncbi:MAG: hypothetical protein JNJ92_05680 [Altererythrobacter sp.]|nr:hypothetical protein [Altererythrobacter sp.]
MKLAVVCLFALGATPLAAQDIQAGESEIPAQRDSSLERTLERADRERGPALADQPAARIALADFGACVARKQPREAARVLSMDFTSTNYRTGLRMLGQSSERDCAYTSFGRGTLRGARLLFAGAVAEALVKTDAAPLNVRLARQAGRKIATYAPSDAVAQCLARSLPDQVSALFASRPASEGEAAAGAPLLAALPMCARAVGIANALDLSIPAVRAIVATATFRLLAAQES